jgi:predicted TIM-barrel fold metal-dependent hydrolase
MLPGSYSRMELKLTSESHQLHGRIVDGHAHAASTDFIPRSFIEGAIDNMSLALSAQGINASRVKLLDLYLEKLQDHNCDRLAAEMAEAGIEKAVLLLPDFTFALRDSSLTIAEMIERHRLLLEKRPDAFLIFAGVDPRWGRDGVALFARAVSQYGFHGLKLYPPCGYSPSDPGLFPFYEICAEHNLPVVVHVGGTSPALSFETAHPVLLDQAARKFPAVNFILAHGSSAYVDQCVMMCAYRPNLFLDVSAYQATSTERLREIFTRGINHKIIFGTDWPVFRLQANQKSLVESLLREDGPLRGLSPRELHAFFRGTMARLLKLNISND